MKRYVYVVLTNPKDGRENEYNEWYSGRHLADVLRIPGVNTAQRFRVGPIQRTSVPSAHQYLALYDIETDNLNAVFEEFRKRARTEAMPISDALDDTIIAYMFEPCSDRLERHTESV